MLGLGIMRSVPIDEISQIKLFKKVGFDAFFSDYPGNNTEMLRKTADELGLIYQSIHAPFDKMRFMWYQSEKTTIAKEELKACISDAATYNVPIVIIHPFIGFDVNEATELGLKSFREVVDFAKEKGVKIAFENVEGEAYLKALMDAFKSYDNVGFCWDTGHEMCYNKGKDMLSLYGDRLIATHINDNMGVSGENITFLDDLHLLPFDGIKDWQNAMNRLNKYNYHDIMTFEFKIDKNIDAKYKTGYSDMDFEDYLKKIYTSAQMLLKMREV